MWTGVGGKTSWQKLSETKKQKFSDTNTKIGNATGTADKMNWSETTSLKCICDLAIFHAGKSHKQNGHVYFKTSVLRGGETLALSQICEGNTIPSFIYMCFQLIFSNYGIDSLYVSVFQRV